MAEKGKKPDGGTCDGDRVRVVISISMTKADKERLSAVARKHDIALSAFLRIAADEYIKNHTW